MTTIKIIRVEVEILQDSHKTASIPMNIWWDPYEPNVSMRQGSDQNANYT